MKSLYYTLLIILLAPVITLAQKMKTVSIETNQVINQDAQVSWLMIQDWSNLHNLVPEVVISTTVYGSVIGSTWEINLKNGGKIIEEMTYFNDNERTLSYRMTETPMPIQEYAATLKVEPYGIGKSLVSFHTSCLTEDQNYEHILNGFKAFQETYLSNLNKQEYE